MSISKFVKSMDELVLAGQFIEAGERFFQNDLFAHYGDHDKMYGKDAKINGLRHFLSVVDRINEITLHKSKVNGDTTFSLFTFDFTEKSGQPLHWYEVIRRVWSDGKVVEEEYIQVQSKDQVAQIFKGEPKSDKSASKAEKAVAPKAAAPAKAAEPKAAKAAAPKKAAAAKPAKTAKPDDLKKIEGIGPKIEELLNKAGITTFAALAKTKVADIQKVLDAAGKRYQIHNPSTWPAQADLAAKGQWEKLATWQQELNAGKTK